ncbi:MAG: serine/threonine-protein kinase, partial [Sorangiineae bacterium]|nr:serine/threonine-protein kinase [Sorangiineae bacterium]
MSEVEGAAPSGLVAGKYRLTRLLGKGGMGSVWEGVHTSLGTRVAVKFIEAEYAESAEARSRFQNEARAAAALTSKHVVQVYDHGVMDDGRPYIVMEFLAGEPLDQRLDRQGRLGLEETTRIIHQVCRALAKAHEAGIVHRDLKPENVFLVWDDEDRADIVKVVDFGIAKFTDGVTGASSATRTGSLLGTPNYMSPEQARGLRSVDFRSDLWSVGVITYRCVVGELPFNGEAIGDLLVKICTAPLPRPSTMIGGLSPAFDAWFERALAREPGQRFSSAAELADSLAAVSGAQLRSAAPTPPPTAGPGAGPYPSALKSGLPALTHAPTTLTPFSARRPNRRGWALGIGGGVLVLGLGAVLIARASGTSETLGSAASAASAAPAAISAERGEPLAPVAAAEPAAAGSAPVAPSASVDEAPSPAETPTPPPATPGGMGMMSGPGGMGMMGMMGGEGRP